jgi:hypothetical protein
LKQLNQIVGEFMVKIEGKGGISAEIKGITQKMTEQFGIEPKVYLTPHVS